MLARRALVARLDVEEAGRRLGDAHHAGGVVEDDEPGRAQAGADELHRREVGGRVEALLRDDRGGDTGERGLEAPAGAGPSGVLAEEPPERGARLALVDAGARDVAAHREEQRPRRVARPEPREGLAAEPHDACHAREGLDVVDERRVRRRRGREQPPLVGRVVRLARERVVPLNDLEQRLLLAEEVLLRPLDEVELVVAHEPCRGDLVGRGAEPRELRGERRLHGDVNFARPDDVGRDERPLQGRVGAPAEEVPILEGAGLPLGRVADDVAGGAGVARDRGPLDAGGEAGAAAAPEARAVQLGQHGLGPHRPPGQDRVLPGGAAVGVVGRERGLREQMVSAQRHALPRSTPVPLQEPPTPTRTS